MSENLELEIKTENDVSTLVVKGYINNLGGERIAEVCYEHIDANTHNFILDLEDCRIVNSIGISILIEVIEKVKELGDKEHGDFVPGGKFFAVFAHGCSLDPSNSSSRNFFKASRNSAAFSKFSRSMAASKSRCNCSS